MNPERFVEADSSSETIDFLQKSRNADADDDTLSCSSNGDSVQIIDVPEGPDYGILLKDDRDSWASDTGTEEGDIIEETFSKSNKFNNYQRNRTKHPPMIYFHCPLCSYKARTNFSLKLHVRKLHCPDRSKDTRTPRSGPLTFHCSLCSFRSFTNFALNRHLENKHRAEI